MNIQARSYRDNTDLARMRQLLVTGAQANVPASYTHPGALDWALHYPPDEHENGRNIRLWESMDGDPPTLEAWAIFLRHDGAFDLYVSPALHGSPLHEAVMAEYVAWAEVRAREAGLGRLQSFWVLDYDTVMDRLMKAHGFDVEVGLPPPLFGRSLSTTTVILHGVGRFLPVIWCRHPTISPWLYLDELPTVPLPDGFVVQGVNNLDDGRLRAVVTHGAFRPNDDWHGYWAEYVQFIGSAVYAGERDLFVRSPDGRGASACTIWFDPVNGVGLFEPVATHPDFQGKGLGKAVMAEGLRRMKAAGMRRAVLGCDPNNAPAVALYRSMGFTPGCYFLMYRKELPPAA